MSHSPFVKRFASRSVDYPAPVDRNAEWLRSVEGYRLTCPLPALGATDIVVPGLTLDNAETRFRFLLDGAATGWFGPAPSRPNAGRRVEVPVDYFSPTETIEDAALTIEVSGEAPPTRFIATVSVRPAQSSPHLLDDLVEIDWQIPCISQLDAPAPIRMAVCSPTAVAMVTKTDAGATRRRAWHAPSRLFGVWPQNIWAAARAGHPAAIETASSWRDVMPFLQKAPVIASIRFREGELDGAPLESTSGHMVVVRGVTGQSVIVNDPAAPSGSVERRYPLAQFTRAWMTHRGVFYVIDPSAAWRSSPRELG